MPAWVIEQVCRIFGCDVWIRLNSAYEEFGFLILTYDAGNGAGRRTYGAFGRYGIRGRPGCLFHVADTLLHIRFYSELVVGWLLLLVLTPILMIICASLL